MHQKVCEGSQGICDLLVANYSQRRNTNSFDGAEVCDVYLGY